MSLDQQDLDTTGRLRDIFRQVPGLQQVRLEVHGGVAVLRGEVSSFEAAQQASQLAQKLEAVVAVDNGLTVATTCESVSRQR